MSALSERDMRILAFERRGWRSPGRQGTGHRRGARYPGDPVLPAAQRADRPAGGARLRPGSGQAPARAAGPAAAHPFSPVEGAARVTHLPRPATPEGRAGLDALLARPGQALLATDFDGTLAPIVADPRAARPLPGAVPALRRLARVVGTVRGHHRPARSRSGGLRRPRRGPGPHRPRPLRLAAVAGRRADRAGLPAGGAGRPPGTAGRAQPGRRRRTVPGSRTRCTRWPCTPAARPIPDPALAALRGPLGDLAERLGPGGRTRPDGHRAAPARRGQGRRAAEPGPGARRDRGPVLR